MPSLEGRRMLEVLLDLKPEDVPGAEVSFGTGSLPDLSERIDLYLKAVYGDDHVPSADEAAQARSLIIDVMACEIARGDPPEDERIGRENAALFRPLFALLVEGTPLREEEQKRWQTDAAICEAYRQLKTALRATNAALHFPAAAAAAADGDDLHERRFEGGSIRMRPSSRQGQIFVILNFELPAAVDPPSALLLEGCDGELARLELPRPDGTGQIIVIKDLARDPDALAVRLLRHPLTVGTFLA
jgi:hypothetical protein